MGGYDYQTERAAVFSENGQRMFLSIRDRVKRAFSTTGAITVGKAINGEVGSSWTMMACVDRLEELGEVEIIRRSGYWTQDAVVVPRP